MKTRPRQMINYFLQPYPWLFTGVFLTALVTSILEGLNVAAFFPIFQSLLGTTGAPAHRGVLGAITAVSACLPFHDPIISAALLLIGITFLKCALTVLREGVTAYASGVVQHDVKHRLMHCYAHAPYAFFLEHKQGKLSYDALQAATRVGTLMQRVPQFLAELLKVAVIALFLVLITPMAAMVLLAVGLAYAALTHHLSRRVSYHTGKGRAISSTEQTTILNEFLTGIRQILTFGTEQTWLARFRRQSLIFRDLYIQDSIWLTVPRSLMEFTAIFLIFGFVAAARVLHPQSLTASLPVAGVFTMALFQLLPSLTGLGRARMEISGMLADAEVVHRSLSEHRPRRTGGERVFSSLQQDLTFDRVTFAYRGREVLLQALNVTFPRGRVTALVGPSGSGKTTIVNLILGLFEPTAGRILVDGVDLYDYRLDGWLARIGFVSQDPFIYHASVAENICFGRDGHAPEAVRRAAEIANAHGFIAELPQGYDTVVGDRGMKLSGGQQQRIAIARAVLDNPEIFIFDEATSSLDTISERLVQDAIEKISQDRTVIVIAHRLSTIRHADKIVVLDGGRVVEEGTHEELLSGQGQYFHLVSSSL